MTDTITLRDGSTTKDRRLDRLIQFDERSRNFPIMALAAAQASPRSYTWACRPFLDQGREGACVGFSMSHELAANPVPIKGIDNAYAQAVYKRAQEIDEWPGSNYEGTSVLAGVKVLRERGLIEEFRWSFGIDDAFSVGRVGPGIAGIPWLGSMFETRPSGLLEVSRSMSDLAGYHAILTRGTLLRPNIKGEPRNIGPLFRLRNSWGPRWGKTGDCFIKAEDFEWLLQQQGELCIPVVRRAA